MLNLVDSRTGTTVGRVGGEDVVLDLVPSSAPPAVDNDRIRAYTISLAPEQSSAPIELGPGVLAVMPGVAVEQTKSGGKSERVGVDGPRWRWRPAGSYVLRNRSGQTALAVEVEIK